MIPLHHPLEGEILAPGEMVRVYVKPSPFTNRREEVIVPAGASVAEIVSICATAVGGHPRSHLMVRINGEMVPRSMWAGVRVKPAAIVNVFAVPAGESIGKILGAVVAIVAFVVAPFIAAPLLGALGIAAGTAAATAITAGIGIALSVAGNLAINALFPKQATSQQALSSSSSASAGTVGSEATSPTYAIGGGQNKAQQFGYIPQILGRHRVNPPFASNPYTEIVGDDQYLRMLFCVGHGPLAVSDIKIGETAINAYDGVTYELVENHLTEAQTLYTEPVYEEQLQIALTPAGSWNTRTTADNIDEFSVDVSMPGGIYQYKRDDGTYQSYTIIAAVQYRAVGSSTWISAGNITITSNNSQAFRRSLRVVPAARGQFEVRLQKSSADYTGLDTVSEQVNWIALRGRRNTTVIKYPRPLTLISLRIKASSELNGIVSNLNCIAESTSKGWTGTEWVDGQITRNPADLFRFVLQGRANARPVADSLLDLETLQHWHDYCRIQGFEFNHVRDFGSTVWETLQDIAAAGRGAVVFNDGRWSVVWDKADSPVVQHFTPRNSSGFEFVRVYKEQPHAFRVSFINQDNNWLNDERIVYDDGYDETNATKFEGIDFTGITSPDLVWRFGRYHIAQNRLRPAAYKLDVDFEGLICTRGDRVRVNHSVVKWGAGSARVVSTSSGPDTITVDDTFTMEAGKTYSVRVRLDDGASLVRTIITAAGETKTLTLAGSGSLPEIGDLVMFGENGLESVILRVKEVKSKSDFAAQLILVDDAPAIANADTGAIPAFITGIAPAVDYRAIKVRDLLISSALQVGSTQSAVTLSWVAPTNGTVTSYIVQMVLSGNDQWTSRNTVDTTLQFPDVESGIYDFRVRAIFDNGTVSAWNTSSAVLINIADGAPPDVINFRIATVGGTALLQWDNTVSPLIKGYRIKFSPLTDGSANWSSASILVNDVLGTNIQVPAMTGTYLIKAYSYRGTLSDNAAIIISNVPSTNGVNIISTITESPTFAGTKTNVFVTGGEMRLGSSADIFALTDFFGPADFFLGYDGLSTSGTYYFASPFDLGAVYTSRISASVVAIGEQASNDFFANPDLFAMADIFGVDPSKWDVTVYVRTTNDDPSGSPTWSAWVPLVVGDHYARGFDFKAVLSTNQTDITPVVSSLSVAIDMPDRVVAGTDLAVTTAGRTITFSPPFRSLNGIGIAAQGMATGDYYDITSKTDAGFTIQFKDAAGTPVARTFDYVAKGYGVRA